MKKEKIEQNPEAFKVVKPEKPKTRMPKFFKIIIGLIVILAVLFIFFKVVYLSSILVKNKSTKETDNSLRIRRFNILTIFI